MSRENFLTIRKLILQESGTYNPLYYRPYQTTITNNDLNNISNRIMDAKSSITGALLAGVATNIINPSANHQGLIHIPSGWEERRIRFVLEVGVSTNTGTNYKYYFQGFTSHLGITQSGNIDPNMDFYINSFLRVSTYNKSTPFGIVAQDVVTESAHVINGRAHYNSSNPTDKYLMRPQDIFTGIQSEYLKSAYNTAGANSFTDTRTILSGNDSVRSKRSNAMPSNYLANIANSYKSSLDLLEFGQDEADIYGRSTQNAHEELLSENPFLRAITNLRGFSTGYSFKISDLEAIDQMTRNVTKYITMSRPELSILHSAGQTEYWHGSNRETVVATTLVNAVPAIMMDLMISKLYFRATNNAIGAEVNILIIDGKSLTETDPTSYFETFKTRLRNEVLYDISYGNQDIYSLEMSIDLFGETKLNISIGGGNLIPFSVPSFCDSLVTPIVAVNKDSYYGVLHDYETLVNNLSTMTQSPILSSINQGI